ncbi:tubulin-specific chaperone C-like [Corticium candelabrum]|uniref:tubulin-specific chaperone C-like n=1 Tax=Corticium candelabrum TaxID=121492 RepID=UPI002E272973|nr:tubulin-specific chaperone C-like [Corticium candelabrum]
MADESKFEAIRMRMEERRANIERKREVRLQMRDNQEAIQFFNENFAQEKADIERRLGQSDKLSRSELSHHFDQLTLACHRLQKFLADSIDFLSSFDVRKAQEDVSMLLLSINQQRTILIPKKKFTFTTRRKEAAKDVTDQSGSEEPQEDNRQKTMLSASSSHQGFTNRQNEHLDLQASAASGQDILLSDLEGCTVRIYGTPSTIHIDQLTDCRIFCGPVQTSIFIDRCQNCTLVLACQQLRVHRTHRCHLYIYVSSKAIIEDCSAIGFACYNWVYDSVAEHFKTAGLDPSLNNWREVNDFNWLNDVEHSPNWYVISDEERILHWDN